MSGAGLFGPVAVFALDYGRRSLPVTWTGGYRELQNERTQSQSSAAAVISSKQAMDSSAFAQVEDTSARPSKEQHNFSNNFLFLSCKLFCHH